MWEKIKKILQKEGGKCIIIEENEPSYLVMKIDDYEKFPKNNISPEIERFNRDIDELNFKEKEGAEIDEPENHDNQEVKIEDLPF